MPPGLREIKRAKTEQSIYDAAMRLFAEQGFNETTVDQIAEAALVSRATFFNYFGTKAGVLRHYSKKLVEHLTALAEEEKTNPSPLARMRRLLEGWLGHIAAHREEAKQVYLHSFQDPRSLLNQSPLRQHIFNVFTEMLTEGRQRNEVRNDVPVHHLAGLVLSVYQTVAISYLLADEPLETLLESAWRFVVRGVQSGSET